MLPAQIVADHIETYKSRTINLLESIHTRCKFKIKFKKLNIILNIKCDMHMALHNQ